MLSGIEVSCIADSSVGEITELSAMVAICMIGVVVTLISPAQLKNVDQQQVALTLSEQLSLPHYIVIFLSGIMMNHA